MGERALGREGEPAGAAGPRRGGRARDQWQPDGLEGEGPPGDPVAVAKTICLRLLTARPRTGHELAEALRERGIPDGAADQVLRRFTEVGLIDDGAFAEVFVRSRHRERGLGRSALRRELERKGVERSVADRAIAAIDDDDERARARELVLRKLDSAMFAGPDAARRRLLGMLARRGYGPSIAIPVINEALRGYLEPLEEQ